jgi:hypothetical protein
LSPAGISGIDRDHRERTKIMRFRLLLTGAAAASLAAAPAAATHLKKADQSWGKAGVSFADYETDARECSNRAFDVRVVMKPYGPAASGWAVLPAQVLTRLTPGTVMVYTTDYVDGYVHAAWVDTVNQLQDAVDSCLTEKGYSRFRLTSDQRDRLDRLPKGSTERAHYLHSLGSDGAVLAAQAT